MSKIKKTTLCIDGMHCASCNILIEDELKKEKNIHDVKADFSKQKAEITYTGQLNHESLNKHINPYGYKIADRSEIVREPFWKRLADVGVLAGILFIIYFFAQDLGIIPEINTSIGSSLTFLSVFILGLVASTSTCMATSGALFIATIGKQQNSSKSLISNLLPAISFNAGRILSYGLFGFIVGSVGNALLQNAFFSSIMSVFIAVAMIFIGLSMLNLFSFSPLTNNSLTKNIFQALENRFIKHPRKTSFLLGAITYLLPCGFTQSVQLYTLGLANPFLSAAIMMVFALGTTPLLIALAFTNSFKNFSFYPYFQKIIGIIIFAIGFSYAVNFLTLHGLRINIGSNVSTGSEAKVENGTQVVRMKVHTNGYEPNTFTVKQNVPVRWIVEGENVFGCQGFLVAPQMNVQATLKLGENVFEFTPKEKGLLTFSCSMGMYRGQFNVI